MGDIIWTFLLILAFLLISFLFHDSGSSYGYKQGQIDAINGKIEYILVVHPDKTTSWENKGYK